MKRNIILFVAAAFALLSAASCGRKVEYQFESYATMYSATYTVAENAGEIKVPVQIKNATGAEVQLSVKVTEGSAVEGVDYEVISPASGLLTFSGETDSLEVVVAIKGFEGEFTGDKTFDVSIASATDGFSVGLFSATKVTISDLDHPLNAFIGKWKGTLTGYFGNWPADGETTITVMPDPDGDPFKQLLVDGGINPYFLAAIGANPSFEATVDGNYLIISVDQPCGYSDCVTLGFNAADPSAADSYSDIYFEMKEDGTLELLTAYGPYTPSGGGFYEIYLGGSVFTKQ